jgi:hypothetical protein
VSKSYLLYSTLSKGKVQYMTHKQEVWKEAYKLWKDKVAEVILANPRRSYQDLGLVEFGVSRSRICQIAKEYGIVRPRGTKKQLQTNEGTELPNLTVEEENN